MTNPLDETPAMNGRRGPLPGLLGRAMSRLYGAEVARRNRKFDRGIGVVELDRVVISVGNLSVGGTGKTPMVAHLARILLGAGHRPCIAMRGYKARPGRESDEAAAYASDLPGVPVIARPDRATGLIGLFASPDGPLVDCVLLDDGFQHRQLARDVDLVLVDATRSPFEDSLLPAGWLREPVTGLQRATGVILTHAESVNRSQLEDLRTRIEAAGSHVLATCAHEWTSLDVHESGRDAVEPTSWIWRRRVFAVCAIGNPGPFMRAVDRSVGGTLAGSLILRDHDPYEDRTVERLLAEARAARADSIVTTSKDWSKLRARRWELPVARPRLALRFESGEAGLREVVLGAVRAARAEASR
ncbi:MAG: tetraacyldisaccharide 4'-kinase [Phycisphaerales bacterium]|nr:tetraacyldisaccharide 4'-kinase [Phycisphaerales bacterium]